MTHDTRIQAARELWYDGHTAIAGDGPDAATLLLINLPAPMAERLKAYHQDVLRHWPKDCREPTLADAAQALIAQVLNNR